MTNVPIRAFIASVIVLRQNETDTKVLLLKRNETLVGSWCQVVGKIEQDETAWQAGLRELHEETGLVPDRYYSGDVMEQFYEADSNQITIGPVFVAYVPRDAKVTLNEEHSDFAWLSFPDALNKVPFAGQRRVLRQIQEDFVTHAPSGYLQIEIPKPS